ncbi:hypothetical protein [uncultured Pontibacter sp.]|uniref:hypothetical protein n=1 Tax=uncultured Pontibacter sp. TaxID=453356 RepID=UPI00262618CE|nr:hypothetical protein [uncultured Pontibacter sp.]
MWSQKGWDHGPNGNIRVARFKPYTWARIFRKGDDNKDVFFTVGVDSNTEEIVYKIDYYKEDNSYLNSAQKELIRLNIPKEARWKSISLHSVAEYDWDKILTESSDFYIVDNPLHDLLLQATSFRAFLKA